VPLPFDLRVQVLLDGEPVQGATVVQGGNPKRWTTDAEGWSTVTIDPSVPGEQAVVASHPESRTVGLTVLDRSEDLLLELQRYDASDNELYQFLDPGEPDRRFDTGQCAHCHITMTEDWAESRHRRSSSNPKLHDLYAGAAAAFDSESACNAAGGQWLSAPQPGADAYADRCFLGDGVIPELNVDCGPGLQCGSTPTAFGACADCHAPGIDGRLGGRDLLLARDHAYDYGIHCDVCHKVESIDLAAEAGVAGRLNILRPSEDSPSPALGAFLPIQFGPYLDVPNVFMGAVPREFFRSGDFCAGCHQLDQPVLVPGAEADLARWPDGRLPVNTTYAEWAAGPYSPGTACQSCHMPGDAVAGNSSDLGNEVDIEPGMVGGWYRPAGSVRRHIWWGPRTEGSELPEAIGLDLVTEVDAGELTVRATVSNVGAGHAIPSGEAMRSMVLLVEARCNGVEQSATGGHAVPDFGGHLGRKESGADWSRWPGAQLGQVVRVVRRTGAFHDYTGFGSFGDGTFDASQKGMPVEDVVGRSRIVDVQGDVVTFDQPLPAGDVAYLGEDAGWPADGDPISARAGAPGFAFARVLVGSDGQRMVPHFLAADVASDNRLLPSGSWTSEHRFSVSCGAPEVRALVTGRGYPLDLARERGWDAKERAMREQVR
jgi:hypothetical protein